MLAVILSIVAFGFEFAFCAAPFEYTTTTKKTTTTIKFNGEQVAVLHGKGGEYVQITGADGIKSWRFDTVSDFGSVKAKRFREIEITAEDVSKLTKGYKDKTSGGDKKSRNDMISAMNTAWGDGKTVSLFSCLNPTIDFGWLYHHVWTRPIETFDYDDSDASKKYIFFNDGLQHITAKFQGSIGMASPVIEAQKPIKIHGHDEVHWVHETQKFDPGAITLEAMATQLNNAFKANTKIKFAGKNLRLSKTKSGEKVSAHAVMTENEYESGYNDDSEGYNLMDWMYIQGYRKGVENEKKRLLRNARLRRFKRYH